MKLANFSLAVLALFIITLSSCKKDKAEEAETTELPAPSASSTLNLTVDNKTYNLKVIGQTFALGDTAKFAIDAISPEMTLRLRAGSTQHISGVGNYFLLCCSNDIYDKTAAVSKHWMTDQRGTTQDGIIKITKMDAKGYEGTYSLNSYDSKEGFSNKKEFTGSFTIIY